MRADREELWWAWRQETAGGLGGAALFTSLLSLILAVSPSVIRSALGVCSHLACRHFQLKTRSSLFSAVSTFVVANHPYQTPEIIELPIQQGHKSYLEWIKSSTKGEEKGRRGQKEGRGDENSGVHTQATAVADPLSALVCFLLRCCWSRRSVGALIATHVFALRIHIASRTSAISAARSVRSAYGDSFAKPRSSRSHRPIATPHPGPLSFTVREITSYMHLNYYSNNNPLTLCALNSKELRALRSESLTNVEVLRRRENELELLSTSHKAKPPFEGATHAHHCIHASQATVAVLMRAFER